MNRNYCDGLQRRDMLRMGAAGVFGMGLTLPQILAGRAQAAGNGSKTKEVSLIILFLQGGLSTIDTWDMKPQAPAEFRGEFKPINTNVPGIQLCEHLPRLAGQMDKFSLVRSFGLSNSDHGPADHYLLTGYRPGGGFNGGLKPNNQRPAHGAVIAKKLGPRGAVPPYVCLPKMHNSAGSSYLGSSAAPFTVEADPNAPDFIVPDLAPPLDIDSQRLGDRRALLQHVDRFQRGAEAKANRGANAMSTYQQKAFELMTSSSTKNAFDISRETEKLRDEYGRHSLGQSCLMARRLVEAGVRCVLIDHTNWDTHFDNFKVLKNDLLPHLDTGMSTLFRDLHDRGLLETTMVLVTGEFGRTPRINKDAGRDHWGPLCTLALAGGGLKMGQVVGESSPKAEVPKSTPIQPKQLMATIFHVLGIDQNTQYVDQSGRPQYLLPDGAAPIRELI